MTLPNTPLPSAGTLIARLEEIDAELAQLRNDVEEAGEQVGDAKREFEYVEAETRLQADGTVQERQDKTVKKLWKGEEYRNLVAAETRRDLLKSVERILNTRASIAQSELRAMKEESYR